MSNKEKIIKVLKSLRDTQGKGIPVRLKTYTTHKFDVGVYKPHHYNMVKCALVENGLWDGNLDICLFKVSEESI